MSFWMDVTEYRFHLDRSFRSKRKWQSVLTFLGVSSGYQKMVHYAETAFNSTRDHPRAISPKILTFNLLRRGCDGLRPDPISQLLFHYWLDGVHTSWSCVISQLWQSLTRIRFVEQCRLLVFEPIKFFTPTVRLRPSTAIFWMSGHAQVACIARNQMRWYSP